MELKFGQAEVANVVLVNDKSALLGQIESLKDRVIKQAHRYFLSKQRAQRIFGFLYKKMAENEEDAALIIREYREKSRAYQTLVQQWEETQKNVERLQVIIFNVFQREICHCRKIKEKIFNLLVSENPIS